MTKKFNVTGMHCQSCSKSVEMNLMDLPGVTGAKVDYESGFAEVTYDQALVSEKQIIDAIQAAGYEASEA